MSSSVGQFHGADYRSTRHNRTIFDLKRLAGESPREAAAGDNPPRHLDLERGALSGRTDDANRAIEHRQDLAADRQAQAAAAGAAGGGMVDTVEPVEHAIRFVG